MKELHRKSPFARALIMLLFLALAATLMTAKAQDEIRVRARGDIGQMDSAYMTSINDYAVADNVYSNLVRFRPGTGELEADLATDWLVSEDGLTYTFHLREDVVWHKGFGPFTSEDVRWSLERILDPASNSPHRFDFGLIETIETPDAKTVIVHVSEPDANFLAKLAYYRGGFIMKREAIEQFGDSYTENAVGTGPFMLESWAPGQSIVLTRNPDYYEEGIPRVDRVVLVPIADEAVAAGALEAGELQLGYFRDPQAIERFEQLPEFEIDRNTMSGFLALYFDTQVPPFDDVRVRRALAHAIDKEGIVNAVLTGVAEVANSPLPPAALGFTTDVTHYAYDPEAARALLAEANASGFTTDLLTTRLAPWPLVNPVLHFYLQDLGLNVELRELEHGTYTTERQAGNYGMVVLGLHGPPDPETWMSPIFHSGSLPPGSNMSKIVDAEIDAMIEEARTATDPERRQELYVELQQRLMDEALVVPLFYLGAQLVRHESIIDLPVGNMNDFPLELLEIRD